MAIIIQTAPVEGDREREREREREKERRLRRIARQGATEISLSGKPAMLSALVRSVPFESGIKFQQCVSSRQ